MQFFKFKIRVNKISLGSVQNESCDSYITNDITKEGIIVIGDIQNAAIFLLKVKRPLELNGIIMLIMAAKLFQRRNK